METRQFTERALRLAMHPRLPKHDVTVFCGGRQELSGGQEDLACKTQYVRKILSNTVERKFLI